LIPPESGSNEEDGGSGGAAWQDAADASFRQIISRGVNVEDPLFLRVTKELLVILRSRFGSRFEILSTGGGKP
jgi:hypothetical protein